MSVTIDPRRLDAVLLVLGPTRAEGIAGLIQQLQSSGVGVDELADAGRGLVEAADRLAARPGRCAVVTDSDSTLEAARDGGFALVVGVDRAGGDAVVHHLQEVTVRTGDRRMSELPDAVEALATSPDSVLRDRRLAVFYDFDGTLSDIVDDPEAARLVPGAAEALRSLTARCPVAVLSGRDLADIRQRIGLPGIWYAGSHGFELTGPDGAHHENAEAAATIPGLEEAAAELRDQLGAVAGVAVEQKRFGVAVHYRNTGRDRVGQVLAAVRSTGQRTELRVTTGREVIELRPNINWDKGKTLRWVLDRIPQIQAAESTAVLPIYLGDDITDEDAFDAIQGDGVGIVVRHTDHGDRATAASYALDSPAEVGEFTEQLADLIGGKRAQDS